MSRLRIGMRTVKTAIAVVLSIFIGNLLGLSNPLFAGFSAVVVMQGTIYDSLRVTKDRMLATITGALVALLFYALGVINYLTLGLGVIAVILFCIFFKMKGSVALGCMVFIIVFLSPQGQNHIDYALHRTLDTFIGLVVGTLINLFVFPPDPFRALFKSLHTIETDLNNAFLSFIHLREPMNLPRIQGELVEVNQTYKNLLKQGRLHIISPAVISEVEDINDMLFRLVSHLTVVANAEYEHSLSSEVVEKIQTLDPSFESDTTDEVRDLYDEVYGYHMERIASLLLTIREKMAAIYEADPRLHWFQERGERQK